MYLNIYSISIITKKWGGTEHEKKKNCRKSPYYCLDVDDDNDDHQNDVYIARHKRICSGAPKTNETYYIRHVLLWQENIPQFNSLITVNWSIHEQPINKHHIFNLHMRASLFGRCFFGSKFQGNFNRKFVRCHKLYLPWNKEIVIKTTATAIVIANHNRVNKKKWMSVKCRAHEKIIP